MQGGTGRCNQRSQRGTQKGSGRNGGADGGRRRAFPGIWLLQLFPADRAALLL